MMMVGRPKVECEVEVEDWDCSFERQKGSCHAGQEGASHLMSWMLEEGASCLRSDDGDRKKGAMPLRKGVWCWGCVVLDLLVLYIGFVPRGEWGGTLEEGRGRSGLGLAA